MSARALLASLALGASASGGGTENMNGEYLVAGAGGKHAPFNTNYADYPLASAAASSPVSQIATARGASVCDSIDRRHDSRSSNAP